MKIKNLLIVTGNDDKAREFSRLLNIKELKIEYKSLSVTEIQGLDIHEIGRFKTEEVLKMEEEIKGFDAVLTDDTSLTCEGLSGLPGTLIKWFMESLGPIGLLELLKGRSKAAKAICLLTLGFTSKQKTIQFEGVVEGELIPPTEETGFGWDPIFKPDNTDKTYATMGAVEKNKISHRSLATAKLSSWIISQTG